MRYPFGACHGRLRYLAATATITSGVLVWSVTPGLPAGASGPPPAAPVGYAPQIPRNASSLGAVPPSQALRFDLVLDPRDPAGLRAFALGVSTPGSGDYRHFLTPAQFAARFGQRPSVIRAAGVALRAIGLIPGPAAGDRLVIPVTTTIGQASASLHTGFARYRLGSGRVAFANTAAPRLPAAVASLTAAVIGLNDLVTPATSPRMPGAARRTRTAPQSRGTGPVLAGGPARSGPAACQAAVQAAVTDRGWTYPSLASAYSISGLYRRGDLGQGIRIALFELAPTPPQDIATFQRCYRTHVPVRTVEVDGGASTGTVQNIVEATLDVETVIALAPRARLSVYSAPDSDFLRSAVDLYTRMFDDDTAQIVSSSFGVCEPILRAAAPGFTQSESTLFEQAATEGISVFAAAGDDGSEDCYELNRSTGLAVDDPASQPFVTGVGGTTLTDINTVPPAERAWNDGVQSGDGAGGGGISVDWAMPRWQKGFGVINGNSSGSPCRKTGRFCREVPDVSASADPRHGYIIRIGGNWVPVGGTSAATPLWASMLADVESHRAPARAGFLNPLLYAAAAAAPAGVFHDITIGGNDYTGNGGPYPATPGYDLATGLGSPVATGLARVIWRE